MTLLKKINKFLTEKEPAWRWELFCVLFCVITIWYLWIAPVLYVDTHFYYPLPLFKLFRIPHPGLVTDFMAGVFPGFDLFFILKIFCVVNLFLLALGFFRKFFVLCSLVSFFFFQGWLYGYIRMPDSTYVYHHTNIIFFILLIHLIAPAYPPPPTKTRERLQCGSFLRSKIKSCFSPFSSYLRWPRELVILTIGLVFGASFISKALTGGVGWFDGHTLRAYMLEFHVYKPSYGWWVAGQNVWFISLLSLGVGLFELTAPVGFLWKKTRLLYACVGLWFHAGVYLIFGFNFAPFQFYYVVFIPEVVDFLSKKGRRKSLSKGP